MASWLASITITIKFINSFQLWQDTIFNTFSPSFTGCLFDGGGARGVDISFERTTPLSTTTNPEILVGIDPVSPFNQEE